MVAEQVGSSGRTRSKTISRVPSLKASAMSWVTMKTVMPVSRQSASGELLHVAPDAGIERAERLVEEEDLRLLEERLGDGEALLHAAGELRRVAVPRLRRGRY